MHDLSRRMCTSFAIVHVSIQWRREGGREGEKKSKRLQKKKKARAHLLVSKGHCIAPFQTSTIGLNERRGEPAAQGAIPCTHTYTHTHTQTYHHEKYLGMDVASACFHRSLKSMFPRVATNFASFFSALAAFFSAFLVIPVLGLSAMIYMTCTATP